MLSDSKSEAQIENEILTYLAKIKGAFFWKNVSTGFFDGKSFRKQTSPFAINGVADILGIINGRLVAFEVKTKQGRLSPAQEAYLDKVMRLGGVSGVVRSCEDAHRILQQAFGLDVEFPAPSSE